MMQHDVAGHAIPQGVDEPVPILFWSPQDFMTALMGVGIGILLDSLLLGVFLGWAVLKLGKRLRRGAKRGATIHFLWGLGLNLDPSMLRNFPDPTKNEYFR